MKEGERIVTEEDVLKRLSYRIKNNKLTMWNNKFDRKNTWPVIQKALKKQIPMKPIEDSCAEKTNYVCSCGWIPITVWEDGYRLGNTPKYCERCGQELDWSELN